MSSNSFAIAATTKLKMKMKMLPAGFSVTVCNTAIQSCDRHSNRSFLLHRIAVCRWRCWCCGRIGFRDCSVSAWWASCISRHYKNSRYNRLMSNISFAWRVPELSDPSEEGVDSSDEFLSQFFAPICQKSVDAKLIYRNHRAEKQLDVSFNFVEGVDFLPCPLLPKSPLSKALDALKNWVTRFCYQLEYHHCCSSAPLSQNMSCTMSFLVQVPRMTNDRKGICEHTSRLP